MNDTVAGRYNPSFVRFSLYELRIVHGRSIVNVNIDGDGKSPPLCRRELSPAACRARWRLSTLRSTRRSALPRRRLRKGGEQRLLVTLAIRFARRVGHRHRHQLELQLRLVHDLINRRQSAGEASS